MKNTIVMAVTLLTAGIFAAGSARAQQAPAAKSPSATAAKTPAKTAAKPAATTAKKPDTLELKTDKDKISYAIGMNIARNLQRQGDEFDPAIVQRGMKDKLAGGATLMTEEEETATLKMLEMNMRKKQQEEMMQAAAKNKSEGEAFLAANKTKEGVVTLPSGLQYKILTAGTGPKPAESDSVVCNYKLTLVNGTEIDSSAKHGQPATLRVDGVIKGWTEALQMMPTGSKWELFVPPDLAYGEGGKGPIGPDSTLIFEVELISIQGKPAAEEPLVKPAVPASK